MSSFVIRCAEKQDIHSIYQLEAEAFADHGYPHFFFRQAYDCWSQNLFVAKKGADNLGFILSVPALNTASRDCWILSLAVSKLARGQGIAKSLLNYVIEKSKDHYDRLLLTVDPENQAALTLYQSVGFQVIAEELDYFGEGEARLQMAYLL
ncbi:GNAT family N-acetyltransferase [Photobacterium damselae]|uniref:GNAT family N-acetyltransferase n=1 Tax=Photobacterium damselae TaxID=38293 RepID=UPI001EFD1302|nr:GNAT family N-acetyltransferase [Photobacterium damselae]